MHAAAHRTDPAAPNAPANPDRRRHGRVRCPSVTCRFAGQVQDMSASGLRLRLDRPSPAPADSALTLILASANGAIEVKARIVWSRPRGRGCDLGLVLEEAPAAVRTALFNLAWNGPDAPGPSASLGMAEPAIGRA